MLIRFRVKNFLSFKDEVELSMIAGKTRQHKSHMVPGGDSRYAVDLLRGAVIYGANASGKSNLIRAVDFAKKLVLEGTKAKQPISTRRFKLDAGSQEAASKFEFEIRTGGKDYLYGFEVTTLQVVSEWLYLLKLTTEEMIFERETSLEGQTTVRFNQIKFADKKDAEFLQFVARGTRPNQLFLTETIEKNVSYFEAVHRWFSDALTVIFPETAFSISDKIPYEKLAAYLEKFDTGICGIEYRKTIMAETISKAIHETILKYDKENKGRYGVPVESTNNPRVNLRIDADGNVVQEELLFRHRCVDGDAEVDFGYDEESDGSMRLIDLIPVLFLDENDEKVVLIDEMDRSLHPNLCYQLIDVFLSQADRQSQMIVTTHESNLLTFDLMRRDEIWFMEKNQQGVTNLYSLEEFAPRYDKDIQKGYLLGRFGAIPIIGKKQF